MVQMKTTALILFAIFSYSTTLGQARESVAQETTCAEEGTILRLNLNKCGGCWRWIIKVGNDTLRAEHLPLDEKIRFMPKDFPKKVRITVVEKHQGRRSLNDGYYEVECIKILEE